MAENHKIIRQQSESPVFTLIPFNDIIHSTDINYIIRGLLPREGLVVVYGPPKCGKSFWVMDMVLRVSLNWKYRKRKIKNGNVIYIACEGVSGITARIEAFRQQLLQDDIEHIPFYLIADRLNLIQQHHQIIADIKNTLLEKPPHIIVIDTLNRSLIGDENSSIDMGNYIKAADLLRETFKCCVILIHHSGYDATHARGHTSLPAAIDAQIKVSMDKDTKIIESHLEFMKDGDCDVKMYSSLKQVVIGQDIEQDDITSCIIIEERTPEDSAKDKLSPQQKTAMDSLKEAIEEKGDYPPPELGLASWMRVVSLNDWRLYFYQNAMVASSKPEAKRQALHRASEKLLEIGLIGFKSDYVWIA